MTDTPAHHAVLSTTTRRPESFLVDERRRFRARILLVENDSTIRSRYHQLLSGAHFNVAVAASRSEGLAVLDEAPGIELIVSAYSLGDKDRLGGIALTDKLQSMWADPRPDRLPSVLLIGSPERLEEQLMAEEHGAYFSSKNHDAYLFRNINFLLRKRRHSEQQQVFSIEHFGRISGSTYCHETELISAIYARHRSEPRPLRSALRERLTFDMLARFRNRWLSLKDLTVLLKKSGFHSRHNEREWQFSPRSLKQSLHLLRDQIEECATDLRADFRANQLLLMKESGRYERLYKLNCEVVWMHP